MSIRRIHTVGRLALVLGLALAKPLDAAALDLASYLALTPGNWAIFQDTANGAQSGYVTTQNGEGQIVKTWYSLEGGTWVYDSADLFTVTGKRITYLGFMEGGTTWLLEPALELRRKWSVGDAAAYVGQLRNQTTLEAMRVTRTVSLTDDKIALTVPAGSFTNCIKLRVQSYHDGTSRDSSGISCPGRSEMKSWYNKIIDTGVPTEQETESSAEIAIQAGLADPPIP